jgi:hypothetical protein
VWVLSFGGRLRPQFMMDKGGGGGGGEREGGGRGGEGAAI